MGPTGLRNNHINMWMGAFASELANIAIEQLEDFIINMANG